LSWACNARAVRRSRRGRWASVSNAFVNAAANGVSFVATSLRRYFGCVPGAARSHRLIVLRDKLVSLAISLIDFLSRKYMPRILPIKAMVITLCSPAAKPSRVG